MSEAEDPEATIQKLLTPQYMTYEIESGDRDAILLALAKLSITRPGWHPACLSRIAESLGGAQALRAYNEFRTYGEDRLPETTLATVASAIANARAGRRGAPPIENVLDILPPNLRKDVIEDAAAVILALLRK
jgi:hypothetical protein